MPKTAVITTQAAAFDAFDAGKLPKDLHRDGTASGSAYKWFKQWSALREPTAEGVEEPTPIKSPTDPQPAAPRSKGKSGAGVTEETAGLMLQVGFGIWANLRHSELCYLTPSETKHLQGPFAATLAKIPNPVAELVNTYSPPVAFVAELIQVISAKQALLAAERAKAFDPLAQRANFVQPQDPDDIPDDAVDATARNMRTTGVAEPETLFRFG
jgi:hypothetical protein